MPKRPESRPVRPTLQAIRRNPKVARFEENFAAVAGTHFHLPDGRVERPTAPFRIGEKVLTEGPNIAYVRKYNSIMGVSVPSILLPSEGERHFEFRPTVISTVISKGKPRLVPVTPHRKSLRSRVSGMSPTRIVIRKVGEERHEIELQDFHGGRYRPTYIWFVQGGGIIDGQWGVLRENR